MQASLIRGFIFAAVPIFIGMVLSGCGGTPTTTTTTTVTTTTVTTLPPAHCLCIFDVDRTLTGKQCKSFPDCETKCPNAKTQGTIQDSAYGGGTLRLSEVGLNMDKTFCAAKKCFHGIVSAGQVSGVGPSGHPSPERDAIFKVIGPANVTLSSVWQDVPTTGPFSSSLVLGWPDGQKQNAVTSIVEWFMTAKNMYIPNEMVHFFDDRDINVNPFKGTGYNAHEISCDSRDPSDNNAIGLCGAQLTEIVDTIGVTTCASRKKVYV